VRYLKNAGAIFNDIGGGGRMRTTNEFKKRSGTVFNIAIAFITMVPKGKIERRIRPQ